MTTVVEQAVLLLLAVAAGFDIRFRKVPNLLVFTAIGLGLLYQLVSGSFLEGVLGLLAGFMLALLPVLTGGMGMGDQKLLMAIGAWTTASVIYTLFTHSLLAGLLIWLCFPRAWIHTAQHLRTFWIGWLAHRRLWLPDQENSALSIPYAFCLFLADVWHVWVKSHYAT
ncbi:prepilin peptidase [Brevibacillus dissolubilis]|uniref:prepilin peptidase n=1 Tax=Brevibacillus dissolubilis TaxID=1844116 RepID=UPI001116D9C7|nr:A24 family peptidase [Brevibacillus dissolubilis]